MAAGRPTLLAIDGVIRNVIEDSKGGIFVQPGDDEALAKAILQLSKNAKMCKEMGESARKYVIEHFNRGKIAENFVSCLTSIHNKDNNEF